MATIARFFSARVRNTPTNAFSALVPLMKDPRNVNLSGGVPPPSTWPIESLEVRLKDGSTVTIGAADAELAQRYAPFAWGKLRKWTADMVQQHMRPPATCNWDVSVTAGSMSGVDLVFSMVFDEGDIVLMEEFSFTASIDWLQAARVTIVPVACDAHGVLPQALRDACSQVKAHGGKAKAFYTIPTGQNPTGSCLPAERMRQVYEIASQEDLLILEDDAYFFLQHSVSCASGGGEQQEDAGRTLRLGTTFLSMDTEARVVRLDSFSKVMAAGFRLGWITAPKEFIAAYDGLAYFSSQHGCSLSMMVLGTILESWGPEGFARQVRSLQEKLRTNVRAVLQAADEHLSDVASWSLPESGMFLWVRLREDVGTQELLELLQAHQVLGIHGDYCSVQKQSETGGPTFLRLSYVLESTELMAEGIRRLGELLRQLYAERARHQQVQQ